MAFTYKRLHISSSGGTGGDSDKIRVSVSDLLNGFLDEKLEVGSTKITKQITNPGDNETLQLDIDETQIDHNNTLNYDIDEHRKMDDNVISLSSLWSSQKTKTYVDDSVQEKIVEKIELQEQDIFNKFIRLSNTPIISQNVILTPEGGITQIYGIDYLVSGNRLIWNELGLEGVLEQGDILIIQY